MTVSNLIPATTAKQTFTCTVGSASGGYQGSIRTLYDKCFLTSSGDTATSAWNAVRLIADPDAMNLVYVAIVRFGSKANFYVGKAATTLTARYSTAGPTRGATPGGLQRVFDDYTTNVKTSPSLDFTIYGTSLPCFIEGWACEAALGKSYNPYNIIDPN